MDTEYHDEGDEVSAVEQYGRGSRSRHLDASWALEQEADAAITELEAALAEREEDAVKKDEQAEYACRMWAKAEAETTAIRAQRHCGDSGCESWAERSTP